MENVAAHFLQLADPINNSGGFETFNSCSVFSIPMIPLSHLSETLIIPHKMIDGPKAINVVAIQFSLSKARQKFGEATIKRKKRGLPYF